MDLGKKIQQVLKYYPSVYIHGLGVFKKVHQSATYDEQRNVFLPPIDYIEFDERNREGLDLIAYLQQENTISRSDAEALVMQEVEEIHTHIAEDGKARIAQLGDLLRYGDGYVFKPLDLSSFVFEPISNIAPITPVESPSEQHTFDAALLSGEDLEQGAQDAETNSAENKSQEEVPSVEAAHDADDQLDETTLQENNKVTTPVDQPDEVFEPVYPPEEEKVHQPAEDESYLLEDHSILSAEHADSVEEEQSASRDVESTKDRPKEVISEDVAQIAEEWGADEPILDADHTAVVEELDTEVPKSILSSDEDTAEKSGGSATIPVHDESTPSQQDADFGEGVEAKFFNEDTNYDGHSTFEESHSVEDHQKAEAPTGVEEAADPAQTDSAGTTRVTVEEAPPIVQNKSQGGRPVESGINPLEEDYPYASEYVDEDSRSNTIWYILAAVVALSIIGGLWYATRPVSLYSGDSGMNLDEEYENPYAIDEVYDLPPATDEMLDTSAVLQNRPDTGAAGDALTPTTQQSGTAGTNAPTGGTATPTGTTTPAAAQPTTSQQATAAAANKPVIPANHTWYIVIASRIPADDAKELVAEYHRKGKKHVRILYGRGENGPSTVIWDSYVNKEQADVALKDVRKNYVADAWPSSVKK